ncbi:MAG: 2-oxoglutarate dehydrogenase E1 component, partial [Deltaproteobacteria bacterium]|nr:2-oxoglutarate dehydrogenase E1 component [Deltaproteobacteria bacterium]
MNRDFGINQGLVEELFLEWCANPSSVPEQWREFFDALPPEDQPTLTSAGAVYAPDLTGDQDHDSASREGNGHRTPGQSVFLQPTEEQIHFVDRRVGERTGPESRGQGSVPPTDAVLAGYELQGRVTALMNAYRVRGHLYARLDPLGLDVVDPHELMLERYGLDQVDPETIISTGDFAGPKNLPVGELVRRLEE